jgi:hypothetical protein
MTLIQTDTFLNTEAQAEKPGGFTYPFASVLAQEARILRGLGVKVEEWRAPEVDLDEAFRLAGGPILELGGPTETGFYFLEDRSLPSRPVVTNRNKEYYDGEPIEGVELIIDGRELPFGDETLGVVLSAHIPKYDIQDPKYDLLKDKEERNKSLDFSLAQANEAMQRVSVTQGVDEAAVNESLRLAIAQNIYDKLVPNGLYLTDADEYEVDAYRALGFEVIASFDEATLVALSGSDEHYFSLVLRKPDGAH